MSEGLATYEPFPKQAEFHQSEAKFRLVLGAWGSGKTKVVIWEDIVLALEFPGSLGVIYRKTYPALRDTTKRDYLAEVPPEIVANEIKSEGREEIEFVNGSKTLFRCLDDFRKLGSTQFDRIAIDEAWEITEEEFRTLAFGRLRGKVGPRRLVVASNPPNRDHWMYDFFVTKAAADTAVFHYATYDNKANLPEDYIARLEKMPEQWRRKFLLGEWGILVSGTPVFADFRQDVHVIDAHPSPLFPLVRGWDFGFRHPACVALQYDPLGRATVLWEKLGDHVDLRTFAQEVLEDHAARFPGYVVKDYCDVAGTQSNDRGPSAVNLLRQDFGLLPMYRKLGVFETIERMRYLIKTLSAGQPLLRFDKSCRLLQDAFAGGYVMDDKPGLTVAKELPKKDGYFDNLVDALRYALAPVLVPAKSPYAGKPLPRTWRVAAAL